MALDMDRRALLIVGSLVVGLLVVGLLVGWSAFGGSSRIGVGREEPSTLESERQAGGAPAGGDSQVAAGAARLSLPEAPARQEGELVLSGAGFAAGEPVAIALSEGPSGPAREVARFTADSQGRLTDVEVALPEWVLSGAHIVEATGQRSGRVVADTLYVRAKDGFIELEDYAIQQSGTLGLVAGGFEAGEEVAVYLAPGQDRPAQLPAEPVATVKADPAGNTDWSEVRMPLLQPGRYALVVRGAVSEVEVMRVIEVQPLIPLFELNPWSGPPGTQVAINGRGYKPGEEVRVVFEGSNEPAATLIADEYGNVNSIDPIAVPPTIGAGDVSVVLEGAESGARTIQRFSVIGGRSANTWGELSSYAGPPGSAVYFGGGGFANGEQVTVHVGDRSGLVVASGQAGIDGRLSRVGPATVPSDAGEEVTFSIVGESSGAEASVKYKVLRPLGPTEPEQAPAGG